jgi:hypothetical protein
MIGALPLVVPDNRPDTGPGARTRKGADVGRVGLRRSVTKDTGTEGQVGRHDDDDARGCARVRHGERTGGRSPGLARGRLAPGAGRRTAAEAADLRGVAGWGPETGPQSAEADAPLARQRAAQRAAGDGAQRWPQHGGDRRPHGAVRPGESGPGRVDAAPLRVVEGPAGQAGVHSQARGEEARARYRGDRRQMPSGCDGQRAGTRVGGQGRAEVLRIPARPELSGRDRRDLLDRGVAPRQAPLGARRGPDRGLGCMVTLLLPFIVAVRTARPGGLAARYAGLSCVRCGRGRRGARRA